MKTKVCTKCGIEKSLSEFYKQKSGKFGYRSVCKLCVKIYDKNKRIKDKINCHWKLILKDIKTRCNNSKHIHYHRYGGRGIKCLITEDELKLLWFRDKAYNLKQPSIDRIDNNGDYTFENCQWLENSDNVKKALNIKVNQFDLEGNFIREWESMTIATQELGLCSGKICQCCKNKRNQTGGFKWTYTVK